MCQRDMHTDTPILDIDIYHAIVVLCGEKSLFLRSEMWLGMHMATLNLLALERLKCFKPAKIIIVIIVA